MKTWLKIYLICAVFIVIIVNGGMLYVNNVSYGSYIRHEIESTENDFKNLVYSLKRDFEYIEREGYDAGEYVHLVLDMYRERYKNGKNTEMNMYFLESAGDYRSELYMRIYNNMLYGNSCIKVDKDIYMFIYTRNMTGITDYWKGVFNTSLIVTSGIVLIFGVILYLILRRMFGPLGELGDVATRMSEGKRGIRVNIKSRGEIAALCGQFNRMADALETEVNVKQKFVDNFSHEMRTPMTSIRGYGEMLMFGGFIPDKDKGAIEYIVHEADRMLHLSHELLDMAYVSNTNLEMEEIDVDEFTKTVSEGITSLCEKKGVKFNIVKKIEEKIYGSKVLLTSAVVNIAENAIKACDRDDAEYDGGGVVNLNVYRDGNNHCISVKDNGIGISDNDIERILEPFYRVDKARSRKEGGVGLGLTLSMQIVRLHGGDIKIYSKPDEGTEVIIILKRGKA